MAATTAEMPAADLEGHNHTAAKNRKTAGYSFHTGVAGAFWR
jgi:hypothetical protein